MSVAVGADESRLSLRAAATADDVFLRELYLDARPELYLLPPELVDLQIAAQRAQYRSDHPHAVDEVIEVDGHPVGRCWTAVADGELHVLDLAVRPDLRRKGIGRGVLRVLDSRAAAQGVAVRLAVWSANFAARSLYAAAGFREIGAANGRILMRREPGKQA